MTTHPAMRRPRPTAPPAGTALRSASIGATRVAAQRRGDGRHHGHQQADGQRGDHRARLDGGRGGRDLHPDAGPAASGCPPRGPTPSSRPITPATRPMAAASTSDPRQHLAPGRTHRAQQRDLAPALGDQHVEGVPDDEGADQHRDAREDQHDRGEDAHRVAHGGGAVGGHLLAGQRLDAARAARRRRGRAARSASTPSVGPDVDLVDHPHLAEHPLGGGQVEPGQGGAQQAVAVAEADDADQP